MNSRTFVAALAALISVLGLASCDLIPGQKEAPAKKARLTVTAASLTTDADGFTGLSATIENSGEGLASGVAYNLVLAGNSGLTGTTTTLYSDTVTIPAGQNVVITPSKQVILDYMSAHSVNPADQKGFIGIIADPSNTTGNSGGASTGKAATTPLWSINHDFSLYAVNGNLAASSDLENDAGDVIPNGTYTVWIGLVDTNNQYYTYMNGDSVPGSSVNIDALSDIFVGPAQVRTVTYNTVDGFATLLSYYAGAQKNGTYKVFAFLFPSDQTVVFTSAGCNAAIAKYGSNVVISGEDVNLSQFSF